MNKSLSIVWVETVLAVLLPIAVVAGDVSTSARIDTLSWVARVDGNEAVISVYRRTTVLELAGKDFGDVVLAESPHQSINSVEVTVFNDRGEKIFRRSKKDFEKYCGFGQEFNLYVDNCTYLLNPAVPKYPYTVETVYELKLKSLYLLPDIDLSRRIPTKAAVIKLIYPGDHPIRWKLYNITVEPATADAGTLRTLTWTFANLSAEKPSEYLPPSYRQGARIEFAPERFKLEQYAFDGLTWKNVGLWYRALALDKDSLSAATSPPPTSPEETHELADKLYREIAGGMRYVSVAVGIGGWQPHRLAEINSKSYGDCKDLSAALVSRLRSHGITAYPCLILTADNGTIDSSFVDFGFNHVITVAFAGKDTLWYDPTCTDCPPGVLPEDDQGNLLLVVTDTGGVLATTPTSRCEANRLIRRSEVVIDSLDRTTLTVAAEATGYFASDARAGIKHLDRRELDEYAAAWLFGSEPTLKVLTYSLKNQNDLSQPFSVTYSLARSRPLDKINNARYFVPFFFTSRDAFGSADLVDRTIPVWLGSPREVTDTVIIRGDPLTLGDSAKLPADTTISCDWVQLTSRFMRTDSAIVACLTQRYLAREVPVSGFGQFKSYLSSRRQLLDRAVKFIRTSKR